MAQRRVWVRGLFDGMVRSPAMKMPESAGWWARFSG